MPRPQRVKYHAHSALSHSKLGILYLSCWPAKRSSAKGALQQQKAWALSALFTTRFIEWFSGANTEVD
jgi:hypothetical protein